MEPFVQSIASTPLAAAVKPIKKRHLKKKRGIGELIVIYTLLVFFAVTILFPLAYMILTAFKTLNEVTGKASLFPKAPTFESFKILFGIDEGAMLDTFGFEENIWRAYGNTLFLFVVNTFGSMLVCSLAGYAFARFKFRYKNFVFMLFMAVMLLPAEMVVISLYSAFARLNMIDTFWPLIFPSYFGTNIIMIFMFKQFYVSVPDALFEAAKLDGCGELKALFLIMIPVTAPVYISQLILSISAAYGDVYNPTLYLLSPELHTIPQFIISLEKLLSTGSQYYLIPYNIVSAALIVILLPVFIVYIFLQRYFVEGVAATGLK